MRSSHIFSFFFLSQILVLLCIVSKWKLVVMHSQQVWMTYWAIKTEMAFDQLINLDFIFLWHVEVCLTWLQYQHFLLVMWSDLGFFLNVNYTN